MKATKRGNAYRLIITHNKQRYSITESSEERCYQKAESLLIGLKAKPITDKISFYTLFDLYVQNIAISMRGKAFILHQHKAFYTYWGKYCYYSIKDITPQVIVEWRDMRLSKVKPSTVQRQMCLYSSIFTYAVRELFILKHNPFSLVKKPTKAKPRRQRITHDMIQKVLQGLEYTEVTPPKTPRQYVAWCFLFALETAMRKGEILSMTWENVYEDYIHLPQTKNGEYRDVPLSNKAIELIQQLPKMNDRLIPHTANSFRLVWQRNLHRVGLNGVITFHDTRHEAITRLVHQYKIPVQILAKITGHKDIKTLVNTYYNPSGSELAKYLN